MRKLFVTRTDESYFTVADIFGYVIAFFVLWLLVLGYRAVSRVTNTATNLATTQIEAIKTALPSDQKNTEQIGEKVETAGGTPTASLIPEIIPELSNKALDIVNTTSNTASKLLTKDGAKDTISSINSYLNNIIFSVANDVEVLEDRDMRQKDAGSDKDALSSF